MIQSRVSLTQSAATRVKIIAVLDQTDEFLKDSDMILVCYRLILK
jgi:hypothetical protein